MPSLDRPKSDVDPLPEANGQGPAEARGQGPVETRDQSAGKAYWRSLERLLDSPAIRAELAQGEEAPFEEFPVGASEPPEGMNRRTMLSIMGASFAMVGLEGCRRPVEHIVPYVQAPETVIPGIPRHFASTMTLGSSAYGVVVESHENRPSKIEGNELHPHSSGAASVWTQASILGLYDPDRSTAVSRRPKGETEHRATEWKYFEDFWRGRLVELDPVGGQGLMVLSTGYTSPTLARLRTAFAERFPQARFEVYEPAGDHTVIAGCSQATGQPCRPVYHLENATRILALDADILGLESDAVRNARGWAAGRRVESSSDEMNRLYVLESAMTLTGAQADHRLRISPHQIGAVSAALAARLGVTGVMADEPAAELGEKLDQVAEDLRQAGSAALVVAGRRQPPAVHALALAINQALGALGSTVTLHAVDDAGHGGLFDLKGITDAMRDGGVDTLVMLGGNPVYDAPGDVGFADALAQVPHSVHLSNHLDETSRAAAWHLPEAYYLETWGDARAADGTASIVQPLIAPLWDGRSAIEILAQLISADATLTPGHELVRETWGPLLAGEGEAGDFEAAWRRVLHDGVLATPSEPLALTATPPSEVPTVPAAAGGLELTFHPSQTAFDGRFANCGWLQEMPETLTKITWDNAALVSPATAAEQGLTTGDRVTLTVGGRSVEAPIFVMPGQADGSIAVSLGYGRTAAGRVGNGVGYDANVLRSHDAPWTVGGVELAKTGGRHKIAQTQEHWEMAGREIVRETTLADYQAKGFAAGKLDPAESHQLWPEPVEYAESPQWGMAIDLNGCIGCNACIIACQSENNVPIVGKDQVSKGREMHWLRVDRYFTGPVDDPEVVMMPVPCMHCENAPCEQVCPVAATVHDRNGINAMVYNRCIGTRYCSNNCPYKVRRFNFFNYTKDTPELLKMANNPDVTVRSRGVMEKCSYCLQRINEARITAKREDRGVADGEIRTACQQTCPTQAIVFGDVVDEASQVSEWKRSDRDYILLDELNNRPRTSFLAKLRNPNPQWSGQGETGKVEGESAPEHHG